MPTFVRLASDLEERLDRLARETGRSKAYYIKEAIGEEIDRLEYEYGILNTAESYRAGKMKTYSLDEVDEMLGLEDSLR